MRQFLCECKKTKGKLLTVLLPVLGIICLWIMWISYSQSDAARSHGYTYMITSLLMLNAIFVSATAAVMASRLMDMENKGNTYKLLCTLQKKSGIFSCKLLLAALHLLLFFTAQTAAVYGIGKLAGYTEAFPAINFLRLQGTGFLTGILLLILQMFFSLWQQNQLYPLFIGLIGSFIGLFSMFFPAGSLPLYFCPWSYFMLGSSSIMVWDEATKAASFIPTRFDVPGFCILLALTVFSYFAVRRYFLRKEV